MTTATKEQLAALTLPATLPGVVRWGTPVVVREAVRSAGRVLWPGESGVVFGPALDDELWVTLPSEYDEPDVGSVPRVSLVVDLTDAGGRAHVAWAVAGDSYDSRVAQAVAGGWLIGGRLYYPSSNLMGTVVPGLKGIDRADDTHLPDGSRLVDALALRAVALHVLGGA